MEELFLTLKTTNMKVFSLGTVRLLFIIRALPLVKYNVGLMNRFAIELQKSC